ncbi:MAG: adenylate/guanylate cyclase domain-containing protein [Kiloniellales bacterium]|nr:adenylate/guanylate cyclase domain-containing protein [Kiloniellales bacterium]
MSARGASPRNRAGPEQDLSNFPEQNPNPMLRADREGRLLYANSAARKVPRLCTAGGRQVAAGLAQAAKRAWRTQTKEKADFVSQQRIYNFNVVPVAGEGYVNLYGRDVTEARRDQQRAWDLAKFPEENPSPVLRVARDGPVLYANRGAKAMASLWRKGTGQLTPELKREVLAAGRSGQARRYELASDKRCFVLLITPVPDSDYVNLYGREVTEERRAQEQAEDLAKFPEENPSPVLRVGSNGAVLYANRSAKKLAALWQKGKQRLSPTLAREVRAALRQGTSRPFELKVGERHFVLTITPVPETDYVNLYGREVTEERKARQEVDSLAKFPEENPNPVLRVTPRGEVLYANSAAHRLSGLLHKRGRKLAPTMIKSVAQAHDNSKASTIEFATDGRLFALALTPVPKQDYVNVYGRDITEERRASLEVLRVKNFNQNILDNLSNGVLTFDGTRRLTSANPAARALFGLGKDAVSGLSAARLAGRRNAWLLQAIEEAYAASASNVWVDKEIVGRDGHCSSVNVTVVPLRDDQTGEAGLMLVLEDITREKRVKGTMVRFMSDNVVERLLEVDETLLKGTSQEVTVLFSDIRQFARLSERLGAQRMVRVLNAYFSDMVDIIFENGGTLDKFIGDAIMAVFGAPFVSSDDTDNSLRAAIEMVRRLRDFNAARQREGLLPIDIGVGIDTGSVIAGTIGSPKRMDYTVIGEHVNLAARIEAVNKVYGTRILISHHTRAKLTGRYKLREIDRVQVAGVETPVQIFETLDYHTNETFPNMDEVLETYAAGLAHYRERNWNAAAREFAAALNANPSDRPTQILLSRCWTLKARPPGKSWTGITDLAG